MPQPAPVSACWALQGSSELPWGLGTREPEWIQNLFLLSALSCALSSVLAPALRENLQITPFYHILVDVVSQSTETEFYLGETKRKTHLIRKLDPHLLIF